MDSKEFIENMRQSSIIHPDKLATAALDELQEKGLITDESRYVPTVLAGISDYECFKVYRMVWAFAREHPGFGMRQIYTASLRCSFYTGMASVFIYDENCMSVLQNEPFETVRALGDDFQYDEHASAMVGIPYRCPESKELEQTIGTAISIVTDVSLQMGATPEMFGKHDFIRDLCVAMYIIGMVIQQTRKNNIQK